MTSWIKHNGLGCPVPGATIVKTEDLSGERHISRADDEINICKVGSSWIWRDELPACYEITFYRVVKPAFARRKAVDTIMESSDYADRH